MSDDYPLGADSGVTKPRRRRRSSATVTREHLVWAQRHFAQKFTPEERLALSVLIAGFKRMEETP